MYVTNQIIDDFLRHAEETAWALPRTPELGLPPTPVTTPTGPELDATQQAFVDTMRHAEETATLTGPELDATNQAIRDLVRHAEETAWALPRTPELGLPPTPATTPSGRVQTGIFTFCSDPSEVLYMVVTNCWFDAVNGEYVWVDAGARFGDSTLGRIELFTETLSLSDWSPREYYETPQANGALRIISVTGERVLLQYLNGSTIIFNVITRQWEGPGSTAAQPQATERPTPTLSALDKTQQAIDDPMIYALQTAAARPTSLTPTLPGTTSLVHTGLLTDCETLYSNIIVRPINCWLGLVNEKYLFFVAGVDRDDPDAGKIGFYNALPDATDAEKFLTFLTPTRHGPVRIIAVGLSVFYVKAEDGTVFLFDVRSKSWADPGITPTPLR